MGGLSDGENTDLMSKRTHLWLRVAALAVIAALAWLPRGSERPDASAKASASRADSAATQAIHASVAAR